MKNITFNVQINLFLKNKAKGNPCYAHTKINPRARIMISRNYTRQVFCIYVEI